MTAPGSCHPARFARSQRAGIAAAAFCMQLALGAVYGWSVFLNPLQEHFAATKAATNVTFTITLAVLGVAAGFGGRLQQRIGARATATLAGLLYGLGVLLSGLAPSLPWFYLTYGVLGGVGLGLGYIIPLAVLIGWFPDKRGFITGLAVTGFGLGALATSPLAAGLIRSVGVQPTLMLLGAAYLTVVVIAAQFLRAAPDGFAPAGWTRPAAASLNSGRDLTLAEALRSRHWYLLWTMLAVNVAAGAALISVASPLTQEFAGVGPAAGAIMVCVISVFNGIGRLFWGTLSDWIGRPTTFLMLFVLQAAAFAALGGVHQIAALLLPIAIVALCYGGGFGTMPAFAADVFGARNSGTIYGAMLTAWSAGAVAGPLLIASVPYRTALPVIAGLLMAAVALPLAFGSGLGRAHRRAATIAPAARVPTTT
jgi:OFA family oxalate/formate antiporter-like MFS transporter